MPIHEERDELGRYFQWGDRGKKYYYFAEEEPKAEVNLLSRDDALRKARQQERAARARGYGKEAAVE